MLINASDLDFQKCNQTFLAATEAWNEICKVREIKADVDKKLTELEHLKISIGGIFDDYFKKQG